MYTKKNFKTKKLLKEAIADGKVVEVYQPGGLFNPPSAQPCFTGVVAIEGPHYPEPHKWYATAKLLNGSIVSVS